MTDRHNTSSLPSLIELASQSSSANGQFTLVSRRTEEDRPEPGELTAQNYQSAFELLDHAAAAIEALVTRRDQLETSLAEVSARAETAISAAQGRASSWQKLVADLKAQTREMESCLVTMQQRAEVAEVRVEAEKIRADGASRRAFDAQAVAQGLYTKIMSTFSQGSKARDALAYVWDGRSKTDLTA